MHPIRLVKIGYDLKVADPEMFHPLTSIASSARTWRLWARKAEVGAKLVHGLSRDITIKVYPDGINAETADEFFEGCDYIWDEVELSFKARYDRHRAFRRAELRCPFLLTTYVFGNRSFFWNMSVEEYLGLAEGADVANEETAQQLVSREEATWLSWRAASPMAQGLLADRVMLAMTGIEKLASGGQAAGLAGLRDGRVANLGDEDGARQMVVSAMREIR